MLLTDVKHLLCFLSKMMKSPLEKYALKLLIHFCFVIPLGIA